MNNNAQNSNNDEQRIERKFVNVNVISRHLFCTICQEVFFEPKRLNCGHTFCSTCIKQWRQKNSQCPICRTKDTTGEVSRDLIAYNIINDLEVFCINKGKNYYTTIYLLLGCPWKNNLVNLN